MSTPVRTSIFHSNPLSIRPTLNPQPSTRNPQPATRNPQPATRNPQRLLFENGIIRHIIRYTIYTEIQINRLFFCSVAVPVPTSLHFFFLLFLSHHFTRVTLHTSLRHRASVQEGIEKERGHLRPPDTRHRLNFSHPLHNQD